MEILIVKIFKSSRTRISDSVYSSQWINDVVSFQNVLIQFRFDIERFRNSKIFQNFLIRFSVVISSKFSDSTFSSISRLFKLETSISSISSISSDAFSFKRFRRNSVSKIHDSNFSFLSIAFSYSSIITSSTSIDSVSDFNFVNIRDISIEKIIYTQPIDSVMFGQKQSQNQNQFDSTIQTIITATIIAIVTQASVDFTAQFQRFQQNNIEDNNERDDRRLSDFDFDFSSEVAIDADNEKSILKSSENIDFFDSRRENDKNKNVIVNVDRHIYYKNVFVFIDKLKNLKKSSFDHRMRELIVECLRDDALIWHSLKLNETEKNMFRDASMNQWCRDLIRRFKKRDSQTLKNLQIEKYIMQNVRNDKTSKTYVQNIMRHSRIVEFNSIYNQLIMTWNNLNFNFKMQISESITTTIFISFFDSLDVKTSIWQKMIAHRFIQHASSSSDQIDKQRQINKQNRERQNDYQQQSDVDDFQFFYFSYEYWSSPDYNSYQYQNSTFQNNVYQKYQKFQYQFSSAFQEASVVFVLSVDKQFLQLISENASNSKFKNQSQRRLASDTKQNNRNEFDNRDDKTRAFVVDQNNSEKKKSVKNFHNEKHENYYIENENLNYYNSNQKNEIFVNFIASIIVIKSSLSHCRRCRKTFTFNNELHRHFRADCSLIFSKKSKFSSDVETYSIKNFSFNSSTIDATKEISEFDQSNTVTSAEFTSSSTSSEFIIIRSNVDSSANIDIEYEFRDWNYVKIKISFVVIVVSKNVCLNIDANVSFMNRNFFKAQTFNIFIRIMISSLQIRDLDTNRHESWKYVICDIHMSDTKNDQKITSLFRREIHFVDNLKVNMFLNNDIIEFENFAIDMTKKHAVIDSIDIIISLKIRFFKLTIQRSVHFKKITVISSHVEMIVVVHHAELSITKNFLFESNDNLNFILYAHLVDASTKSIIVRNDREFSVMIFRNFRLDKIFEIDFLSDFHIDIDDENVRYFVAKKSKFIHKNDWFKKLIFVCVVIYVVAATVDNSFSITSAISSSLVILSQTSISSVIILSQISMSVAELRKTFTVRIDDSDFEKFFTDVSISLIEIVLSNDVIVYNFDELNSFVKIVEKFSTLWQNIGFAKMSKENWMKISLKSDWKKRVSKKTKMYFLNAKNKKLIDKTFDDLHRIDRMFWTNQSTSFFYFCFCVWKSVDDEKKDRVIIDIRNLNVITQPDAYSLSLQTNIIIAMRDCDYISIIDCSTFFYQWRVHSNDRHKFTVVNHKNQKSFNVIVMNYKNSSTYVQRQIDRLFREYRHFVRIYVNDIMIFSRTKIEHEAHLRKIFSILNKNNISIKLIKIFLDYSSISLLDQKIDSLDLITFEEKLKAIAKFRFSRIFRQLETYFDLIDWLRDYIAHYVDIFKSLQNKKTEFLRNEFIAKNVKRVYFSKTRVQHFTTKKLISFDVLQIVLTIFFYLVHSNFKRQLFIDLNVNKKFDFDIMLYYVKKFFFESNKYFFRHVIKSIFFLVDYSSMSKQNIDSLNWK